MSKTKPATQYTKTLGSLAFAAGIARAPALDATLSSYMGSRQIGDSRSIPELAAWLQGWDQACVAAAVA